MCHILWACLNKIWVISKWFECDSFQFCYNVMYLWMRHTQKHNFIRVRVVYSSVVTKSSIIQKNISANFIIINNFHAQWRNFKTIHKIFPVIEYSIASACLFVWFFLFYMILYRQPAETHTKLEAENFSYGNTLYSLHYIRTASMITSTIYYYCCVIYFRSDNTFSFIE